MNLTNQIDGLPYMLGDLNQFVTESGFSDATRLGYADKLRRCAEWLASHNLDFKPRHLTNQIFLAFLDDLGWGGNGRYSMTNAVRSYVRWKYTKHPLLNLHVRRPKTKPGRSLSWEQVSEILESIDTSTEGGIRSLALITLMLDTGLRRVELSRALVTYLNMRVHRLEVEIKGGEWGAAVFTDYTASCLEAWLAVRARIQNQENVRDEHLFISLQGTTRGRAILNDSLKSFLARFSRRTGIVFSSHDIRRTFATLALKRGAPTRLVQVAGRWKTLAMVERYTQDISAEDMEKFSPVEGLLKKWYSDKK